MPLDLPTSDNWKWWTTTAIAIIAALGTLFGPWIANRLRGEQMIEALVLKAGVRSSEVEIYFPDGLKVMPANGQFRIPAKFSGKQILVFSSSANNKSAGTLLGEYKIPNAGSGIFRIEF